MGSNSDHISVQVHNYVLRIQLLKCEVSCMRLYKLEVLFDAVVSVYTNIITHVTFCISSNSDITFVRVHNV
jgi:hypothetical protein